MLRQQLTQLIFGQATLPASVPTVQTGATSPIPGLTGVASVDKLTTDTGGILNHAYHHRPAASVGRLALAVQGHDDTLGDNGLAETVQALLSAGFDVVVIGMPGRAGNGGSADHNTYTSLRPFVEPSIAVLNLLEPQFHDCCMLGISGGGWTTTVVAAIDSRVRHSFPVAGSLPQALRVGSSSVGDWEQQAIYSVCDYTALYWLACSDGRRQTQILNRNDACCFNFASYGTIYEPLVVRALGEITEGRWQWFEDTTHSEHKISPAAIDRILSDLRVTGTNPQPPGSYDQTLEFDPSPKGTPNTPGQANVWTRWDGYGLNSNMYTAPAGSGTLAASVTFADVPAGNYEVRVSHYPHTNRATNTPFVVQSNGSQVLAVSVNQEAGSGTTWTTLGTFAHAGGSVVVSLSNNANEYICADAARLLQI